MTAETYSLDDLCTLVDLPRRTLRYYIQIGLVDRPEGEKRGAFYTRQHLDQLLAIRKWQQAGLSLDRIRELLASREEPGVPLAGRRPGSVEVWSRLTVAEGLELHVEPGQAGLAPEQVRAFFRAVRAAYAAIREQQDEREPE